MDMLTLSIRAKVLKRQVMDLEVNTVPLLTLAKAEREEEEEEVYAQRTSRKPHLR